MAYTSQRELRRAFWREHPTLERGRYIQNSRMYLGKPDYYVPTDTRCAFVDWIDYLARDGQISESLAFRATLY